MAFYHERAAFYHEKKTVFGHFIRFGYFQSFVAFYHGRAAFYHEKKTVFGHFIRFHAIALIQC